MRFAGLYDCQGLKAHAEANLVYGDVSISSRKEKLIKKVQSNKRDATYDAATKMRPPLLNPVNYAPITKRGIRKEFVEITHLTVHPDDVALEGMKIS